MLILSIFATLFASAALSLFDLDEFDRDDNPSRGSGDSDELTQSSAASPAGLVSETVLTAGANDDDDYDLEITGDPVAKWECDEQSIGIVEFKIVNSSQGEVVTNDGLFIVEGAAEVPTVFSSPDSCLGLFRQMTGGADAPESHEYGSITLIWNGPREHSLSADDADNAIEGLNSDSDPDWAIELAYRVG